MIENLLLQQVLLYTREKSRQLNPVTRSNVTHENSVWVRQEKFEHRRRKIDSPTNESLVLSSSKDEDFNDQSRLFLLDTGDETTSSLLIRTIVHDYNRTNDSEYRFDENLIKVLLKRNRERKTPLKNRDKSFFFRLQWLAIGLVVDRLFFYIYFMATLVSYVVTLWLIPFTHPNLKIDIENL